MAFATGLTALVALSLLTGSGLPEPLEIARMPARLWAGGLIGTSMVLLTIHAVPSIGAASFVAAVVSGQLVAALAYDHLGAFGLEIRRVGPRNVAGAVLLLDGLAMIAGERRG